MPDAAVSPSPALTIKFGKPNHGWLPINFQAGGFILKLDASDVPVNPLELLCEALIVVPSGGDAEVLWFLEPTACWFHFQHDSEAITLTITESPNWQHGGVCILRLTGSVKEILLPFYKGLKEFSAQGYRRPHWPALPQKRIAQIGKILQAHC
jgi:hypothetical protein